MSMEGDPRNPGVSLLKKYDIPIEHLTYEYVEECSNKKELERIIRILRSGEEGSYPDLLKITEERLRLFAPESRVLRVETPILTKERLTKEEWDAVEKELKSWEEEMNIMDKSLDFEKGRIEVVGSKSMPGIRKVVQLPKIINQKAQIKSVTISENNNQRIKSGDYSAWDKFDVDKELLKIDVEEERKQEESEKKKREAKKIEKGKKIEITEVNKENYLLMEQQVLANQAKDRGNECYKSGDLECALKYYEISIRLYPTANAYNNRAMTYLKLKQYDVAIKDCNKVLHLEKNNVKALHRRATAYQNMPNSKENNYDELALQDLYKIIQLEPNNKVAQADLQKLKKKLNFEDTGKKFRMPISEALFCSESSKQAETKTSNYTKREDISSTSAEKLPLTYYGPSTSTFQCEPYSLIHRQLSGSSILGEVLCKCNSSRPRQNPLCQKCGEAMCTPKPSKPTTTKSETKLNIKDHDTNNLVLIKQANKIETKPSDLLSVKKELESNNESNEMLKSKSTPLINEKNYLQQEMKSVIVENNKASANNNNSNNSNELDTKNSSNNSTLKKIDYSTSSLINGEVKQKNSKKNEDYKKASKGNTETHSEKPAANQTKSFISENVMKNIASISNKNNETIITERISCQSDENHNSKKCKNKKKKSKEPKENKVLRKHLEPFKMVPVKVVHAAKYLHPTSVEPKIMNETSAEIRREPSLSSNIQYKAFVPNRKCYSTEFKSIDSSAVRIQSLEATTAFSVRDEKTTNSLSIEGNILENNCSSNNQSGERVFRGLKTEFVDSGFEFMKTWEELKKFDESYSKRAEIIRKIRPGDLSKVIGIKLDSEMLSCLLECLLRHFVETDPKRVVELLKQLPHVPRFGLVSMFLAETDRKKMKKLIDTAENKGFNLDEDTKKNLMIIS